MSDLITLGDSLGFDVAWLAELHFGGAFSLLANPLMAVPVIAARTKRIRIGTAVTLLPSIGGTKAHLTVRPRASPCG